MLRSMDCRRVVLLASETLFLCGCEYASVFDQGGSTVVIESGYAQNPHLEDRIDEWRDRGSLR